MTAPATPVDDEAPVYRGGCRPGMAGCSRTRCGHRAVVEAYREARDAQQAHAEGETLGYAAELAAYFERHPKITFRRWLEQLAAAPYEREAAA